MHPHGIFPSTMAKLKELKRAGPKMVISKVSAEVGGVVGATDACIFARNEQQVMKVKSRNKIAAVPTCSRKKDFAVVVHYVGQR